MTQNDMTLGLTQPSRNLAGVIARRLLATLAAVLMLLPVLGSPAFSAPVPVRPGGLLSPTGQAERIIVVRPNRIDLFSGPLASSVPRAPGELSLPALAGLVPEDFLKAEGDGLFRLRAALVQSRDTQLRAAAPEVKTLLLDSGAGTDGASLQGSGAQLTLSAVKVQAVTAGTSAGAEAAPTRGFLAYRGNSRLSITDTQLDNLGASVLDVEGTAGGLAVSGGSSLTLARSRVSWAVRGISVTASTLEAESVTVRGAQENGIDLQRDSKTSLSKVTVQGSGRSGLRLRPTSTLVQVGPLTLLDNKEYGLLAGAPAGLVLNGVTAARNGVPGSDDVGGIHLSDCNACALTDVTVHVNHGEGISAVGKLVQLRDVVARRNGGNGVNLTGCSQCWITEVTADMNGRVGVLVRESREVTVVGPVTTGNETGISLRGCTDCLLRDLTVRGGTYGVQVGHRSGHVTIGPGTIDGSLTGVDVEALADDVLLALLTITDSATKGLQLEGRNAVVKATSVEQQGGTALSSKVAGLQVSDSRFLGADRGLDLDASASVSRVAIRVAQRGVTVDGPSKVDVNASDIAVTTEDGVGIRAGTGATTTVSQTRVSADRALSGEVNKGAGNDLPFAPDWLGLFMVTVVCAAFGLELTRRLRESPLDRVVPAPDHVSNIY